MASGGTLAAFLAWLKEVSPFLSQLIIAWLGAEWQKRADEASAYRELSKALQKELEDTARANEQAAIVDEAFNRQHYDDGDDAALNRLRDFWNTRPNK